MRGAGATPEASPGERKGLALLATGAVLVAGLVAWIVWPRGPAGEGNAVSAQPADPAAVETVIARRQPLRRTVRVSGVLRSGSEATLASRLAGRVSVVAIREGDRVRRGQLLVRLDAADAREQLRQALAAARAARAQWEKAAEGERLKRLEIDRRIAEARRGVELARLQVEKAEAGLRLGQAAAEADVQRAQAAVDAARSQLARLKKGARPEQRAPLRIQIGQAERAVALAKKNLDDTELLYRRGGVPRVQLDEARENHARALDALAQAKAQLALLDAGASEEEVAAAEAQLRSAEAGLAVARAAASRDEVDRSDLEAARTRLRQAEEAARAAEASRREIEIAREEVRAALAAYEQALAGARLAERQVREADVVSPVDGLVTAVRVHPGETAGPGQPLVTVVGTAGVYLEAALPSRYRADVRPGQAATVTVDADPGRTYAAVVRSVHEAAGPDGRSFPIRIDLNAPAGRLAPGALARAEVTVEYDPEAIAVPPAALRVEGERASVWVFRDGRAAEVPVTVRLEERRAVFVAGAVRAGDRVIVSAPAGLRPGDAVVERARPWD